MSGTGLQALIIFALILANGLFAMAEIAVVSSRKARLQQRAEEGDARAARALRLAEHPSRFLSTVQIGITLVGILAGAFGGATLAGELDGYLERYPELAPYSEALALGIVVLAITYLSLVLGELVPKRIALTHPERIAAAVAGPMHLISRVASPLVTLLTSSTDALLNLFGIRKSDEPPVTEHEIAALIEQGTEAGVFEEEEQELVERVFWLGDQRVVSLMTPRHKIVWLDANAPLQASKQIMIHHRFARFLVCEDTVDRILGMVQVTDLWAQLLEGESLDLRRSLRKPLFVPESTRALRLLEMFRESGVHLAVVLDEYGGTEGLITLNDVLEEISGDLAATTEPRVVQRQDGSWLVDASLPMDDVWEVLGLEERREEPRPDYHTLGGFVFTQLGRLPTAGDWFESMRLRFEVVDMDGNRVDKVLVGPATEPTLDEQAE